MFKRGDRVRLANDSSVLPTFRGQAGVFLRYRDAPDWFEESGGEWCECYFYGDEGLTSLKVEIIEEDPGNESNP